MSIFKTDAEIKRMIFNISADLADRLETAKEQSRAYGKRLDVDNAVNKALEKFLKKVDKKIEELRREHKDPKKGKQRDLPSSQEVPAGPPAEEDSPAGSGGPNKLGGAK
jgi:hypothetical protein